ncbi:MAG: TonB-dependent receptor [Acidobacteria bacterium]|nr:TonB-dependent receptor [Acidobacteriota bacterium]
MKSLVKAGRNYQFVAAVIVLMLATTQLFSQTPVGGLTGVVTDANGAAIAGATVTITRIDTALVRTAETGGDGKYRFSSLAPGEYEVRITKAGFAAATRRVIINVGLTGSLDFTVAVGAATESVDVSAEAPIVDTEDNAVKAQITSNDIRRLPLNGRNFLDLAVIAPGATPVSGDSFDPTKAGYTGVSIGGQAGRSARIALDGGDINDEVVGTTTQNFSPEIIQEFQVSTSSYDVSTGATSSGAVNIITRTGQNTFHGAGYLYFRNEDLAAFPGLNKVPDPDGVVRKPPFDREQFGGWLSGPVIKDRAFWFASFEQSNQDQQAFITTGLAAGNPFDGAVPQPFDERLSTVRLDVRLNNNHTAFGRWSRNDNRQNAFFPAGSGIGRAPAACTLCTSNAGLQTNLANQIVTGVTSSFGSRVINEARFNYSTLGNRISPLGSGPELRIRSTNFKVGTNRIFPQSTFQNRWQLRDDFTWQSARSTLRTGFSWNHTQIFGSFQFWSPGDIQLHSPADASFLFPTSDAELLNWPVRFLRVGVGDPSLPVNTPGGKTINDRASFYVEDSWKIHPRLTLNLGVNYRYDSNLVNHDLPKPQILSTVLRGELGATERDKNNWGGRAGLAWDLKGNGGTVVRAGYGLYYDTVIDNLRLFERSELGPAGSTR